MELDKQKKRKATKESEREREREYRADQTDRQTDRDFDGTSMPRRAFENKFTKKTKQRKKDDTSDTYCDERIYGYT